MIGQNCTDILNCTYDLHGIIETDIITDTPKWIATVNHLLGDYAILTFLILFGLGLFFIARKINQEQTDIENFLYAGFITSVVGSLIYAINTGLVIAGLAIKLITWEQLLPIIVITGAAYFVKQINKRF